jgi:hypothetical protein
MGKKSTLIKAIQDAAKKCEDAIADIEPKLADIPAIPREGGQGYYDRRIKYVETNIVPQLNSIEAGVNDLDTAISGLEAYAKKNAKRFWKKEAAKKAEAFLKLARPMPDQIRRALKDTLGFFKNSVAEDRDVYQQLQRLGVDF